MDEPSQKSGGEKSLTTEETDSDEAPDIRAVLEAVFFAADEPVSRKVLGELLPDETQDRLNRALRQMVLDYSGEARGFHLAEVAGGFQFRSNPEYNDYILSLFESKPVRVSKAAMETLAIVAYRQLVICAVIEEIRGVDCGGVLRTLSDLALVTVVGRMDDIGRPHLYGTTQRFLEFFGLGDLTELPTLDDFEVDALELLGEDIAELLTEAQEDATE